MLFGFQGLYVLTFGPLASREHDPSCKYSTKQLAYRAWLFWLLFLFILYTVPFYLALC